MINKEMIDNSIRKHLFEEIHEFKENIIKETNSEIKNFELLVGGRCHFTLIPENASKYFEVEIASEAVIIEELIK